MPQYETILPVKNHSEAVVIYHALKKYSKICEEKQAYHEALAQRYQFETDIRNIHENEAKIYKNHEQKVRMIYNRFKRFMKKQKWI